MSIVGVHNAGVLHYCSLLIKLARLKKTVEVEIYS